MIIFNSAAIYIDSKTTLKDKIAAMDAVILALQSTALRAAANEDIQEYWLDDGQTKIKTYYKSVEAIMRSIKAFETLKEMYVNKLNGRVVRLVDGKNFIRRNYYGRF